MYSRSSLAAAAGATALFCTAALAQVTLETENLRLHVSAQATLAGLLAKPSGQEYAVAGAPQAIAAVERDGKAFAATAAALDGDKMTVRFAGADVTAVYRIVRQPAYLAFELLDLQGEPVDRVNLLQLRVKRLPLLGPWINIVYDDSFGICLCGANVRTDAGMQPSEAYVDMRATATRAVGLQGTTAVLLGCLKPKERFLDAMEIVERDFKLPSGARNRRSPLQPYSYLFCKPTPQDIGRHIELAKRAGFRMLLFSYNAFTEGVGHFKFNKHFPGGMADLKLMADEVRKSGLKIGLHIHYCKALKTDAYVTPVPDDRLHQVRKFTLAEPLDAAATTLTVSEDPAGCTRDDGRRILKVGKELIAYRDYTAGPPFQFTGCERGHLKTRPSSHPRGAPLGLLNVDDWHIFIRFDQNTDIQDEVAARIAEIVAGSGPYDMVYFDGAEDVHEPRWFNVANAQYRVYKRFNHEPPVCETATMSHFSWHMMSRSNAYDVPGEYGKSFTHEVTCRTAPVRALDFTRIEFGWFQGFNAATPPDVLEYVVSRGAAWDCPFSIQMDLKRLAAHPRGEDCLDVLKIWEDARLAGKLTDAHRRMLRTLDPKHYQFVDVWEGRLAPEWMQRWQTSSFKDQEHHLFINDRGEYELVAIEEVPNVAAGQVRASIFRREAEPEVAYALVWAVKEDGMLRLPVAADRITLMRPFSTRLALTASGGHTLLPVGPRSYLRLADREQARQILDQAEFQPITPQ